jgi:hypothetical protein
MNRAYVFETNLGELNTSKDSLHVPSMLIRKEKGRKLRVFVVVC